MTTMTTFLMIVSLFLIVGLIVGLVKPSLITKKETTTRKDIAIKLGSFTVISLCATLYALKPPSNFSYQAMTLGEYKAEDKKMRNNIVKQYVAYKRLPSDVHADFYRCASELSYTKDEDLPLGKVMPWCFIDYKKDPQLLKNMINVDDFLAQFSSYTGENRNVMNFFNEQLKKENVKADFEHVKTTYRIVWSDNPYAIINTTIKAKFNGKERTDTIKLIEDLRTNKITFA